MQPRIGGVQHLGPIQRHQQHAVRTLIEFQELEVAVVHGVDPWMLVLGGRRLVVALGDVTRHQLVE
jgi:hypothetical protein